MNYLHGMYQKACCIRSLCLSLSRNAGSECMNGGIGRPWNCVPCMYCLSSTSSSAKYHTLCLDNPVRHLHLLNPLQRHSLEIHRRRNVYLLRSSQQHQQFQRRSPICRRLTFLGHRVRKACHGPARQQPPHRRKDNRHAARQRADSDEAGWEAGGGYVNGWEVEEGYGVCYHLKPTPVFHFPVNGYSHTATVGLRQTTATMLMMSKATTTHHHITQPSSTSP
jgi:hypothetical protein